MIKQIVQGVARTVPAVAVAFGVVGCASHDVKPVTTGPFPRQSTSAPQVVQYRSYACGSGIAPPLAPSVARDPVRLAITRTRSAGDRITAVYEISSADSKEMLTYPVSPTPPTVLLMHDGHIVGRQKPSNSHYVDGRAAEGRPIGRHPYVASLAVDQLCPGTDWAQVHSRPGQYCVEIVMSRQPTGGRQSGPPAVHLADPLTTASVRLTR